ncbi:M48 family metallopeptidase [Luteolibacter sp. AS25]|uniref:M48 family metallopeptidase n=1 Tax=Luteolibacter sp. AS25 TaxID=3135776 RepID=UPI00398AFD6A
MNFFEAQERARKSSRLLVWWFILSVIGVIAVMYILAQLFLQTGGDIQNFNGGQLKTGWWDPGVAAGTSGIVGGVIMLGSWFKLAQLSGGGKVVASSLGGRQVEPTTTDLPERRLLNIVEEMAIASGLPVPEVWIMDQERGINAFAAGTDPANAVIGVTRGTLERLTREELQGVVAHEFSHILNGDMKLNMRLMGWIFGLVMLSMLGRMLLESFRFMRGSKDSKGNGVVIAIVLAGLGVWLVGSVGVLFARLLQAAISRQREYLADASAVQFTRNPEGISGALKKIGGFAEHGKISSPKAMEARHMFFAGSGFSAMMATHPPLSKRILAIDPNWKGTMLEGKADPITREEMAGFSGFSGSTAADISAEPVQDRLADLGDSDGMDSRVGTRIREELRAGKVTSFSREEAKVLLLGLLVAADADSREVAERILFEEGVEAQSIGSILTWSEDLKDYTAAKKLALVDLSLSWLRKMSRDEARDFARASKSLIEADGEVNLFEFMLQKVIERHVEIGLGLKAVPNMRHRSLSSLEKEISHVLHTLAALGGGADSLKQAAVEYREHVGRDLVQVEVNLGEVSKALYEMDASTPLVKQQILRLCGLVVVEDGKVDDGELVLLRAVAEAIGAPIPPIVRQMM